MSTDSQKDIFTRLHKLFSDTNQSLASETAMRQSLEAEVKRLQATFNEQNETLKRYEDTFGILPASGYEAKAPSVFGIPSAPAMPAPPAPVAPPVLWGDVNFLRSQVRKEFEHIFSVKVADAVYNALFNK